MSDEESEHIPTLETRQNSFYMKGSKLCNIGRPIICLLLLVTLLVITLIVLKKSPSSPQIFETPKVHKYQRFGGESDNRSGAFPGDEMLDEHGIIQANGNWFPSKHDEEALEVRCKYYKQIYNSAVHLSDPKRKLLMGISAAPTDFQRRQLVRTYQIRPYNNSYDIEWKFFMGPPPPYYEKALEFENATYGDIIVMKNFTETRENSRAIKPMEIFKHVEQHMGVYLYVAKLDMDCYLNIPSFWDEFFNQTIQELPFNIIALFINGLGKFDWPMGAFEAFSWKLVMMINKLYEFVPRTSWAEDLQMGWYLYDAHVKFNKTEFHWSRAYDFNVSYQGGHNDVEYNAIRVHELKQEVDYIAVSKCFTADGVNKTYIDLMREKDWILDL
jgi:hypothetical protein